MFIPGIFASTNYPKGDYESIATVSVGAGGATSIQFSSIPGTFQHLQIRAIMRNTFSPGTALELMKVQFNGVTSAVYSYHTLYGNGSSAAALAASSLTTSYLARTSTPRGTSTSGVFGVLVCDILDYKDTNKFKTFRTLAGVDINGTGAVELTSGLYQQTTAITSITITDESANFAQYSHFALYGIKG